MSDRLLLTAMSCATPAGFGLEATTAGLAAKTKPCSIKNYEFHSFDEEVPAYLIPQSWDAATVLGKSGLRTKDRSTKLLLSTIETGLKGIFSDRAPEKKPGLSIGTAFGSVQSIGDFLSDSIVSGVNAVNPVLFANTVINSPVGNANIRYEIKSLSATSSGTFNAGLDAMIYAADHIRSGHHDAILAGGLEEVSYYTTLGFKRSGLLSKAASSRPFASDADGVICGEGCALFLIETAKSAADAGRSAIAYISGYAQTFDPNSGVRGFNPDAEAATVAVNQALAMAGLTASDISFVASGASGNPASDAIEATVISSIFGNVPVAAYKAQFGESYGAAPALAVAAAIIDAKRGFITGTGSDYKVSGNVNLVKADTAVNAKHVLVTSFSCDGNCAALILSMAD